MSPRTSFLIQRLSVAMVLTTVSLTSLGQESPRYEIERIDKIWDASPHNAFTDLVQFQGRWLCVFREGENHVSPDGSIRIIESLDGDSWQSDALITMNGVDLRDGKLDIDPDGTLMLCATGAKETADGKQHQSYAWVSKDGRQWSEPQELAEVDEWLWRVTWQNDFAWGFAYGTRDDNRSLQFYRISKDGKSEKWIKNVDVPGTYPNETAIVFDSNRTAFCLLRQDGEPNHGFLGKAIEPYREWTWTPLDKRLGGPELTLLPDGDMIAVVRLVTPSVRTAVCRVHWENGILEELVSLPSGGDTSYAGTVWDGQRLWVSYYSSHEGKTSIYLARLIRRPAEEE